MLQHCGDFCGVEITCSCCNVQFSCMCLLHIHLCKEKRVLKYLIDIESCTADIFLQTCLENEISIKTNEYVSVKNESKNINVVYKDTSRSNSSSSVDVSCDVLQNCNTESKTPISTPIHNQQAGYTSNGKETFGVGVNHVSKPSQDGLMTRVLNDGLMTRRVLNDEDVVENDEHTKGQGLQFTERMKTSGKKGQDVAKSSNIQVPCYICGYLFKRRNLKRHMQSHASTKDYTCEMCHKVFRTESSFHCHKLHHKMEKVHLCQFCGKLFNNGPNLRQHTKSHTRERTLQCPICQKMFRSNYVLKDHLSRHSEERPYTCKVCNRSFRKSTELKRHMVAHSETRNHVCKICTKAFKSKSNCIKHEKIHYRAEHGTDSSIVTSSLHGMKL